MSGPFTYFPNIPQATDQIANSQPQILNNFGSIQSIIDVNHGDFATNVAGQHTYVQMTLQASRPISNPGDVGLYNFPDSTPTNQMWVRSSDGNLAHDVPMTKASLANPGYTYLPSRIILQWGTVTASGSNPFGPINFPIVFPNACLTVNVSMNTNFSGINPTDSNTFVYVVTTPPPTTTSFFVNRFKRDAHDQIPSTNPTIFYFLAIGY
jgi:hypothetical protein